MSSATEALALAEPILLRAVEDAWEQAEIGTFEEYEWTWEETLKAIVETDEDLREFEDGTLWKRGQMCDPRVVAYRACLDALGKRKVMPVG